MGIVGASSKKSNSMQVGASCTTKSGNIYTLKAGGVQEKVHKRSFLQRNNFGTEEGVAKSVLVKWGLKRTTSRL